MEDNTAPITLRGLTWGHRRAIDPLMASARHYAAAHPGVNVDWAVRPLSAFEHQPLAELADRYDFIVLDHPFTGSIAASGLFLPVDAALERVPGGQDPASYVGASLASYQLHGRTWALPVDGATMHAVYRADLLAGIDAEPPVEWAQVVRLGQALRRRGQWLGMALGGHHGLLALGSLMANLGAPWAGRDGLRISLDAAALAAALDHLEEAAAYAAPEGKDWNAIALHDEMQRRDDIVYCPVVYGYAAHGAATEPVRLSFAAFPGVAAPHCAGTLLGGAGVGLSAMTQAPQAALDYLAHLAHPHTQHMFAHHNGQPARIEAWSLARSEDPFNGYFRAVRETLQSASVRPRFAGYGQWEREAGTLLGRRLRKEASKADFCEGMRRLTDSVNAASGAR
jgi:multiple sugar transport system substrate-binding protein